MNAPTKPRDWIDPVKAAEAAKALRDSLRTMLGDEPDDQLLIDTIEGETDLLEMVDALIHRRNVNLAMADGLGKFLEDIDARRRRFEQRAEGDKALIEQAMTIADLQKLERPGATLSLSARAPKLVITSEPDIPAQFWKAAAPALDKKALTEALKGGEAVAGACLSNAAPTLTVRVK